MLWIWKNTNGFIIKNLQELSFKSIFFNQLSIIKNKERRNIQILINSYAIISESENNEKNIKKTYDLSKFPIFLHNKEDEKYDSGIFFYKNKKDDIITLKTFEELKEITIKMNSKNNLYMKEINKFFNNISEGNIIYIENLLINNNKIEFNNLTMFFSVDGELLADYFQKKYNKNEDYYKKIYIIISMI